MIVSITVAAAITLVAAIHILKQHHKTSMGSTERARKGGKSVSIVDRLSKMFGGGAASRQSSATPATPTPPAPRPVEFNFEDDRIPARAQQRIRRVLACIAEVEKAMAREQVPGFSRIDMEQMRDIHLPKLVKRYIDIPSEHRSEIFRKTGKSASFILNESLDQMQAKIDEILKNLAQHDIDAFTNNTQFIGRRYGGEDNPFR